MMRYGRLVWLLAVIATAIAAPRARAEGEKVKLKACIYDPSGSMGDAFNMAKDYRNSALGWGAEIELDPYTDEKTAAEDFKAGKCDVALLTGVRARAFNKFSGSIEAMGAVRSYKQLKTVIELLANPKAGRKMVSGNYETIGIFPAGAVYLHLRDAKLSDVGDLAGKRIATLDFDEAAIEMVNRAGASLVPADIGTFAGMFNNGAVDVCYAPATAFRPLELEKGVKPNGGLANYPTAQLTLQILARNGTLPEGFANESRAYAAKSFSKFLKMVKKAERDVPRKYWIDVSANGDAFEKLFRTVRIELKDKGVYDATMLKLLRRVRCKEHPEHAECAEKRE